MEHTTLADVLEQVRRQALPVDDREYCVALHDFVRERIQFGFTSGFETVTPLRTLALGRGHCNAQADLLCALLREAGFEAALRFVALDKRVLRHAVPLPVWLCLPQRLFHAVTRLRLDGGWRHIDSYIFDRRGFERQRQRLFLAGLPQGYGLGRAAVCEWDGRGDAFSQAIAADLRPDDPVYAALAEAVAAKAGNNRLLGIHFNHWLSLAPARAKRWGEGYLNRCLEA
ncbi:transglutaminase family protein [Chromobacterium sp. IIBBL 290-4]|uniref:transglutaminase-like domain-containing protein n=1 Tax=Chromobacterium sp. IIBBL 290-4 TaxID=2953890 RepID=UPI0020B804EB|nr:transglutaminase domain-containing protein [Chromobacterium sp. IIBBL 290-4]UTH72493.1 transglutaminase domain-containing protein [Chromobacterium sp. IIBBL 290-4]